jgi:urease accessory protein
VPTTALIITIMTEATPPFALSRLLQLVSPSLPVGAYAYSTGLEYAVSAGWVRNRDQMRDWLVGVVEHSLCGLDLPVLQRMYRAWQREDEDRVKYWSRFLLASRESAELLAEDRHLGTALARLLNDLNMVSAGNWLETRDVNWAAMFSLAAHRWQIPEQAMQQGYLWAWCENQVAAAVKLVPLGQTAGQKILCHCAEHIPGWLENSCRLQDDDIGQLAPALAIGSALHERQYSRLFRS